MDRYEHLKSIFDRRECFKLVCGAGNENCDEVRKLAFVYTIAGAAILDLSARTDIIDAAQKGVEQAYKAAGSLGRHIAFRPYLNVSIGIKGDPHVRKALIDRSVCTACGKCIEVCEQRAIGGDYAVRGSLCIGCGRCVTVCPAKAVGFTHTRIDPAAVLPQCLRLGVETLELHAVTLDEKGVFDDWKTLNALGTGNYISMCLDRSLLSDSELVNRVRKAYLATGERFIVQADGFPMSGEKDDFNCTLQAVACADIVQKSGIPVKILLSGGTNSKTGALAKQCGVAAHGVAVGSFARKIVRDFIMHQDFDGNIPLIEKAVSAAENLVKSNIEAIRG
ncbi:MAG: 4Fe-4S binding protein [Candidatus Omnitrophota bacterium]